ncbi:MAG: hypothetical protein WCP39_03555 [Chlamydiota bacterium]
MRIERPVFANRYKNLDAAIGFANQLLVGTHDFFAEVSAVPSFDLSKDMATSRPVSGMDLIPLFSQSINVCATRRFINQSPAMAIRERSTHPSCTES